MRNFLISAAFLLLVGAVGVELVLAEQKTISVQGSCARVVRPAKASTTFETIDLNKLFLAGLKTAQKVIGKTTELMENSPKKEYEANIQVSYKDKSEGIERDFSLPLSFALPKIEDSAEIEAFVDELGSDLPDFDSVVKTSQKTGLDRETLEKEYKECAGDALADAKEKADAEAAKAGLSLGRLIRVANTAAANAERRDDGSYDIKMTLEAIYEVK